MSVKVRVKASALNTPIEFEFGSVEDAERYKRNVMTFGLHLNVDSVVVEDEEGNQSLTPSPLSVSSEGVGDL